ncbi:MAG: hypothetical protein C0490_19030, partial [Marivirga sp.]|nr:hypothetical protein [Marivirga sp.]
MGHCSQFKGLPEMINKGHFLIPRLTRDQYREAIIRPLEGYGIRIASNVVSQLLNDIEDDPDQLPVLQHALMLTFEEWKKSEQNKLIETIHYDASGGMSRSIDEHCNTILGELSKDHLQSQTKIVFQRLTLVDPEEGIGIRSSATINELMELTNLDLQTLSKILNAFRDDGRNFLNTSIQHILRVDSIIELSHECIIRKWKMLNAWMNEEEQDRSSLLKLTEQYNNFIAGERHYLRGLTLSNYLKWPRFVTSSHPVTLRWANRYSKEFASVVTFISDSRSHQRKLQNQKQILKYGFLLIALGAAYFFLNEKQKRADATNKATFDSLNSRAAVLGTNNDSLVQQLNISNRVLAAANNRAAAAKLVNDNRQFDAENQELKLRVESYAALKDSLQLRLDSFSRVYTSHIHTENSLKNVLRSKNVKLRSAIDSIVMLKDLQRMEEVSQIRQELRTTKLTMSDSLKNIKLYSRNETAVKEYFASQFAEELKKNQKLLDEFEKRFKTDIDEKHLTPEMEGAINKYISEYKANQSKLLGDISRYHKIELYTYYEDNKSRFDEFSFVLKNNGFTGAINYHPINRAFFNNAGVTILAS